MALQKMVNGVCVDMSIEEEASLKSYWSACEKKEVEEKTAKDRQEFLISKYPNIYETLDAICTQLGMQ